MSSTPPPTMPSTPWTFGNLSPITRLSPSPLSPPWDAAPHFAYPDEFADAFAAADAAFAAAAAAAAFARQKAEDNTKTFGQLINEINTNTLDLSL